MKIGKNILDFLTTGFGKFPEPGRVIFKTIVSSDGELPYVLMNIAENIDICDFFLICEANRSVLGEEHKYTFEKYLSEVKELNHPKIIYIREDISSDVVPWQNQKSNLFANAFAIRDGFRKEFSIEPSDIVISTDGDEVLFGRATKKLVRKLRRKFFQRIGYQIRLHQIVFRLEYLWVDCGFRAPVVSRAKPFLDQANPQWRDKGTSTYFKKGTHFSWVMTPDEILHKILTTAHRVEYEHCANLDLIMEAIEKPTWIFQPERSFKVRIQKNVKSSVYPRSLPLYFHLLAKYSRNFL